MSAYDNQSQEMKNMLGDLESERLEEEMLSTKERIKRLEREIYNLKATIVKMESRLDYVVKTASTLANGGSF